MRGESLPFYMELPPYRLPTAKLVATQVWSSARAFLRRAGTVILAVSILLWCLLSFPRTPAPAGATDAEARRHTLEHSLAGRTGRALEPVLAPLGFDWKIGVGLLASLAAREVIVATLAQIYAAADETTSLRDALRRDADPRFRPAHLHAGDGGVAAGLLRLRAAVHVDHRRDEARDQQLAMAGLRLRVSSRPRLCGELCDPPVGDGPGRRPMKRALLIPLIASLLATGCITRSVKEPVFEQDQTNVFLRSQRKGGETLPKGFGHPLAISTARMAHILSRIDYAQRRG